jgi:hypothetical protein
LDDIPVFVGYLPSEFRVLAHFHTGEIAPF